MDHDHCNHWISLLATFDIPILMTLCCKIKNHYYATPLDHDHCNLRTPLLATSILRLWSSCDSLCPCLWLSPSNTDAICLPATAVTTIRNAQPRTCHPSLSLLWFLQDPCLYHHHHDKTYHHDNHHCHRQPVATFTNFLFMMNSNRQDVFVCVKPTCNKNLDLDFAPRITSKHVLVPLFHNHVFNFFVSTRRQATINSFFFFLVWHLNVHHTAPHICKITYTIFHWLSNNSRFLHKQIVT